jgi:hypothetical protein
MKKVKIIFSLFVAMFIGGTVSFAQSSLEFPSYASSDLKIENKIEIYPNPSVDFLVVTIEKSTLVDPKIIVHSIIGNKMEVTSQNIEPNKFSVDVKNLPAGYYLVAIKDETTGFSKTYKFLKR